MDIAEREAIRIPANLRVRLDGPDPARRTLYSKDLSQGGIFLKTVPPLPLGERIGLHIQLPFPEGSEEMEASGEVVRQVPDQSESHLIPGVGVQFIGLQAPQRAMVGRFVRRRLQPES